MLRRPTSEQVLAFWSVVADSLKEFHGKAADESARLVRSLRSRMEQPPPGIDGDLIFHAEPFDVACDLAQSRLEIRDHREAYDSLLRRYNW